MVHLVAISGRLAWDVELQVICLMFTYKVVHLFIHSAYYIIFRPSSVFALNLEHGYLNIELEVPGKYDENILIIVICDNLQLFLLAGRPNLGYLNVGIKFDISILKNWLFICHHEVLNESSALNDENVIEKT